jgi:hypothetical protein
MTRIKQLALVRELVETVMGRVKGGILDGVIPESFDGHELRVILADEFENDAGASMIRRHPKCSRANNYRNWRKIT